MDSLVEADDEVLVEVLAELDADLSEDVEALLD